MIEHFFIIWNVSKQRIVYIRLSFGVICSKQFYFRWRSAIIWPKSFIQTSYISLIKGQYYIEMTKIIFFYFSCSVVAGNSMFLQHLQPLALGSWKLWGKSRIRSSTKSYKKEEHKGKQEQIQQVVRFTDYISVSTKYKKFTIFVCGQEFHFARLSSQAEQRIRIISLACSASNELISIYWQVSFDLRGWLYSFFTI